MTRAICLSALLAAGCGSVVDRDDCKTSADCTMGKYCAHTPDGAVCWPDAMPPAVTSVTVACGAGGCVRDGSLVVTAVVTDDKEVFAVDATVDFDPATPVTLVRGAGNEWTRTVSLATLKLPAVAREAVVTVRARDGARNEVLETAATDQRPTVTRVRWEFPSDAPLTPPAVRDNGDVLVGRSALTEQLLSVHPDGTKAWSLTIGSGTVTAPPSIGAQAIWVGANDGKLYAVKLDGSGELASPSRTCTASGTAKGPPAVLTTGSTDVAFGAFSNGRIYASGPTCVPTAATPGNDPYTSGVAVDGSGAVFGATSTLDLKAVRRHVWDGAAFASSWIVDVGDAVNAPLAIPATGSVVSGSTAGELERTTAGTGSGAVSLLATLTGPVNESPIVLSNGDIVVGDASGKLHRLDSTGTPVWTPVDLGAAVHAPMALTDGPIRFLVATVDGKLHALDDLGTVLWSGPLTAGQELGAGNIYTPPDGEYFGFSTAYFGGADGKLYAVVVEGRLDTAAPWPKAWHDARNTSRAD